MGKGRSCLLFLWVFLLASGVRLVHYQHWSGTCIGNGRNEIVRIAASLNEKGTFAGPYMIPTGPTAHHAPVFPMLLAAAQRLPLPASLPAQVALNIVLSSLLCASVPLAAAALGMRPLTGMAVGFMLAVRPPSLAVELCNDQEATLVGALAAWAVIRGTAWLRGPTASVVAPGISWGFILLAAPALAPVYAGYLLLATRTAKNWRHLGLAAALTAAVLMPWIVRNRLVLGEWTPVRSNLGLELRVSNADEARIGATDNAEHGAMPLYHPLFNVSIAETVLRDGEAAVYSQMRRDALAWIATHPRRFFELTVERTRRFWLPERARIIDVVFSCASLLFAAAGVFLVLQEDRMAGYSVLCAMILYPLVYYFLQSYERYRYPIEWLIVLCAAHAALWRCEALHLWFEKRVLGATGSASRS